MPFREVVDVDTTNGHKHIERVVVGMVRGEDVEVTRAGAGVVLAGHDVSMTQGGGGPIIAGGDVSFHQGGGGPVLARGNVTLEQGMMQTVIAGGGVDVGNRGFVALALAPTVTVQDGGRVLMTVKQAAAFGAGIGVFLLLLLGRRRRSAGD